MKKGLSETCYRFFVTLANPARLAILEQLMKHPMSVNELVESLRQEQSMISHNLKPLLDCNFVYTERDGKKRIYSVNNKTVGDLFRIVEYHAKMFCKTAGNCRK
jgi:DNA-binding transcriptional ArsR family regulator